MHRCLLLYVTSPCSLKEHDMKASITEFIKEVASDRQFIVAIIVLVFMCLAFCAYVALNIHPSELQVVTHYTAFGSTNFYRDKWYYLVTFVVFGLLTAVLHTALACKLYRHKGRELAVPFAWLGVVIVILATATVYQVLKVAALS